MFDTFVQSYMAAINFTMDEDFSPNAVPSPEMLKQVEEDCSKFQAENEENLILYADEVGYSGGGDFWLTRNGHGVGFWDRGLGEEGEALTEAADKFGPLDVYEGDDGLLYFG